MKLLAYAIGEVALERGYLASGVTTDKDVIARLDAIGAEIEPVEIFGGPVLRIDFAGHSSMSAEGLLPALDAWLLSARAQESAQ